MAADFRPRQSSIGRRNLYVGSPRNNPNPIHAAEETHPYTDSPEHVWWAPLCGVRVHGGAYDRDGKPVPVWDPDHPQACRRCVQVARKRAKADA